MSASESREFYDTLRDVFLEDMGLGEVRDDADAPFTLGRYILTEEVGRGAFSRVWRGIHQDLMKPVAVKVFDGPLDERRRERLTREATTGAKLDHDGIVAIHDVGEDRGRHFIVMDLVEGGTLADWFASDADVAMRCRMIERIAEAVEHAHRHGVLHRDLKPDNVLLTPDGDPVVADFGLARSMDDARMTRDGTLLGTPGYMAPEQVRGDARNVDARTDVYALGVILFEAITGRLPFDGEDTETVYRRILEAPVPSLQAHRHDAPPELDAVCARCLEKDPGLRYPSAAALAEDLRNLREGRPVTAAAHSTWRLLKRGAVRRKRALVWSTVAILLLVVATGWGSAALEKNRRLGRALAIQSAMSDMSAQLAKATEAAMYHRYGGSGEHVRRVVERVDGLVAASNDATGVGEAHRAWVRLIMETDDAGTFLATVRRRHPENPLVPLFAARAHLLRYANEAPMPQTWVPLWSTGSTRNYQVTDVPGGAAAEHLRAARVELEKARSSDLWPLLPALSWMVELTDGCLAYARGDDARAVELLEPLAERSDAAEACLLVVLAETRRGDVHAAHEKARRFERMHPGVRMLGRRLVECLRLEAHVAMARGDDPTPFLDEAMARQRRLTTTPDSDALLTELMTAAAEYRMRTGAWKASELAPLLARHDRVCEAHPEWAPARVARARLRTRAARLALANEEPFVEAQADLDHAARLGSDSAALAVGRIETGIERLRAAIRRRDVAPEEFDAVRRDIDAAERHVGATSFDDYCRVMLSFLRLSLDERLGRADAAAAAAVESRAVALREAIPESPEVEQLVLAARMRRVELDEDAPPGDFVEIIEDVLAAVETSPLHERFVESIHTWLLTQLSSLLDPMQARQRSEKIRRRHVGLARAALRFYDWAVDGGLAPRRVALGLRHACWVAVTHGAESPMELIEKALRGLDDLHEEEPESVAILIHMSSVRLVAASAAGDATQQAEAARRALRDAHRAVAIDETSATARLAVARALMACGRLEEAASTLAQIIADTPRDSAESREAAILLTRVRPR